MLKNISIILSLTLLLTSFAWAESPGGTVKLSPKVRTSEITGLTMLSSELRKNILPFLKHDIVIASLEKKPYIVGMSSEHLAAVKGDNIYVRGITQPDTTSYRLFRAGKTYLDPDTKEDLGHAADYIGNVELRKQGDPATFELINSVNIVFNGDRLLPEQESSLELDFNPRYPDRIIKGKLITVLGGVNQIGKYNAVVINKGARDGVQLGDIFAISKPGVSFNDKLSKDQHHSTVALPAEPVGELMVFRIYEKVSFAIVTQASNRIQLNYLVGNAE